MIYVIKGFVIIGMVIGSIYVLSRILSGFIATYFKDDTLDKAETFAVTVILLMLLFGIGSICYLVGSL